MKEQMASIVTIARIWSLAALMIVAATVSMPYANAESLIGKPAPDFTSETLDGHSLQLSAYRGKVVLLNFWASWCTPCRAEMPTFSAWQRELGPQGLQIIGVSMDDDAASAKKFLTQRPVDYPVVMGDAKLAERFGGVLGLPLTLLIDKQGRVIGRYEGESDLQVVRAKIETLLWHGSD